MSLFDRGELSLYFKHILSLMAPGTTISIPSTYGEIAPGVLDAWSDEDIEVMVEEGRRQLDSLNINFEQVRSRGQHIFTVVLAGLGVASAGATVVIDDLPVFIAWAAGIGFLLVSLLGAAAVFAATAQLGSVDAVLMSNGPVSQVRRILAAAYLRAIMTSADAVRLRFSMLRDSIWFFTVGVIIEVSVWVRALTNEF